MIKYTLYIGCNDKDKKVQVISDDVIDAIIVKTCTAAGLDGFTLSHGRGYYTHDDGSVVFERTCILDLLFVNDKQVQKIANQLKIDLNQASIAVQKQKIDGFLI